MYYDVCKTLGVTFTNGLSIAPHVKQVLATSDAQVLYTLKLLLQLQYKKQHTTCKAASYNKPYYICQTKVYKTCTTLRGHPSLSAMSSFDRACTTSYSSLIETVRLSCTVYEI